MARGVYTRSPEYRQKQRELMRQPATRQKLRELALGNQHCLGRECSPQTREKLSRTKLGNQHALGQKRSPEMREKMRLLKVGNQYFLGHKHSEETKEKMRQRALKQWADPEYRELMRQKRLHQRLPVRNTSIENSLEGEFKKRRLRFEMHKTMFGRWQPDFVFEEAKLIVEADGDYWHSLPKAKIREATMREAAHAEGWAVWRFGEKQIHMHAAACARAVARFVRDHAQDVSPLRNQS